MINRIGCMDQAIGNDLLNAAHAIRHMYQGIRQLRIIDCLSGGPVRAGSKYKQQENR